MKGWKMLLIGVAAGIAISDPEIMTLLRRFVEELKKDDAPLAPSHSDASQ